ncbi:hypothetical protein WA026_004803 [Henosepilachna vigintioctopunctata]|uniref:Uncharacterized protein n=1 Tax=Henosepilachna vigintioctopunctata TaxID=420089 RepID=A0AAW1UTL1_9CUCU
MIKLRESALSKFKRTRSASDWLNYKELRNFVTGSLRREKKAFLNRRAKGGGRDLWRALNSLNIGGGSGFEIPMNLRDPNGINRHFSSVFTPKGNCSVAADFYRSHKFNDDLHFSLSLSTEDECSSSRVDFSMPRINREPRWGSPYQKLHYKWYPMGALEERTCCSSARGAGSSPSNMTIFNTGCQTIERY